MGLKEIDPSRLAQRDPGLRMRWLSSEEEDLFVWLGPQDQLMALQYCRGGYALAWSEADGLRTGLVDDGEVGRQTAHKQSPLISYHDTPDEELRTRLSGALQSELSLVDPELAASVRERLG